MLIGDVEMRRGEGVDLCGAEKLFIAVEWRRWLLV